MALVIVSAGTLAHSRFRTMTMRMLVGAVGILALAGLMGGMALGYQLGRVSPADEERSPDFADLDPAQPGGQALIQQIGSLSGRLIRLEAAAGRLEDRIGRTPSTAVEATRPAGNGADQPTGGPLLTARIRVGTGAGPSLLQLERGLDQIEASLDRLASMVARRDLDQMAFPSRTPIPGVEVSSGFGRRKDPFTRLPAEHAGIDYPAPYGTAILASAGGRVRFAGPNGAYGRTVEIDHGDGLVTRYGHASRILVRVGDILLPGQPIATVGSTGRSTGPHLHFEILRDGTQVNPGPYLAGGDS